VLHTYRVRATQVAKDLTQLGNHPWLAWLLFFYMFAHEEKKEFELVPQQMKTYYYYYLFQVLHIYRVKATQVAEDLTQPDNHP
jgi:hypothetical protein